MKTKTMSAPAAGITGNMGFRQMWKVCGGTGIGRHADQIEYRNVRDQRLSPGRYL